MGNARERVGVLGLVFVAFAVGCTEDVGVGSAPIIDGNPATLEEVEGTVALVRYVDGGWVPFCTGTLIAPDVVLTAAHCVLDTDWATLSVFEPRDIRELGVVAGALDVGAFGADQLYGIGAARTLATYPYLDVDESPSSIGRADDIALLVLLDPVVGVEPVPLLPFERVDDALAPGSTVILSGYGQTETGSVGVLHRAQTTFVDRTDHEVLAGGSGVPDSCFGDSGGPGYVVLDGTLYVWGITSRGTREAAVLCGDGGIYTLAPAYSDWIAENSGPSMPVRCSAAEGARGPSWIGWLLFALAVLGSRRAL